jgi:ABC-2 type transport system permease protein
MKKFLAVVKREYVTRVKSKMFLFTTFLLPLIIIGLYALVGFLLIVKTGDATRLAVVDQSGKLFDQFSEQLIMGGLSDEEKKRLRDPATQMNQDKKESAEQFTKSIRGDFVIERIDLNERSLEVVRNELEERVKNKELDAYIIFPSEFGQNAKAELVARNVSDFGTREQIRDALNKVVSEQRLGESKIDREKIEAINKPVHLETREAGGQKQLSKAEEVLRFVLPFGSAMLIYMLMLIYGQQIMSAVIEEKETRIAEILFSSIDSFRLMLGKLIGVSLVALTQLSIWVLAIALLLAYFLAPILLSGGIQMPEIHISAFQVSLLFVYFVIGYFLYSAIYSLVGSMVTTPQEGGQLVLPLTLILVVGLYVSFPIIRSPESNFAFWMSMLPLWSPVLMPVRMMTQMPPLWQIVLSIIITSGMGIFCVWLAARVYRVGMLMYGKRASIPEALKWIRQR